MSYPGNMQVGTHNARCDACGENPIAGIRYKCGQCLDFDLCERCENMNTHNHNPAHCFVKIRNKSLKIPQHVALLSPFSSDVSSTPSSIPPYGTNQQNPVPFPPAQNNPMGYQNQPPSSYPGNHSTIPGPQTGYPPQTNNSTPYGMPNQQYPQQGQQYPPSSSSYPFQSQNQGYPNQTIPGPNVNQGYPQNQPIPGSYPNQQPQQNQYPGQGSYNTQHPNRY